MSCCCAPTAAGPTSWRWWWTTPSRASPVSYTHLAALAGLRDTGALLLNQAVLLRGVNDDADTLAALSERGHAAGVLPYYLHQLDRVAGAAHFEVDDDRALALHAALVARLPGYLVSKLVREVAGDPAKRPLSAPAPHSRG